MKLVVLFNTSFEMMSNPEMIFSFQFGSRYNSDVHFLVGCNRWMVWLAFNLWNKSSNGSKIYLGEK